MSRPHEQTSAPTQTPARANPTATQPVQPAARPPAAPAPSATPAGSGQTARGPVGKQRDGLTISLLAIVTFGIYWIVYVYKTSKEIKEHSDVGIGPTGMLLLAIFVGIVPPFLLGNDVKTLREARGLEPKVSAMTAFWNLIPLAGIFIYNSKLQGALNEYWQSVGGSAQR
jgi:Domain of unknown function (DUF4234)